MDGSDAFTVASIVIEERRDSFKVNAAFYLPVGNDLMAKTIELADWFCAFLNESLYKAHARCGEPVLSVVCEKSGIRVETPYQGFIDKLPDISAKMDNLIRDFAVDFRKEGLI